MHEEKSLLKEDVELEAHISVKPPFPRYLPLSQLCTN